MTMRPARGVEGWELNVQRMVAGLRSRAGITMMTGPAGSGGDRLLQTGYSWAQSQDLLPLVVQEPSSLARVRQDIDSGLNQVSRSRKAGTKIQDWAARHKITFRVPGVGGQIADHLEGKDALQALRQVIGEAESYAKSHRQKGVVLLVQDLQFLDPADFRQFVSEIAAHRRWGGHVAMAGFYEMNGSARIHSVGLGRGCDINFMERLTPKECLERLVGRDTGPSMTWDRKAADVVMTMAQGLPDVLEDYREAAFDRARSSPFRGPIPMEIAQDAIHKVELRSRQQYESQLAKVSETAETLLLTLAHHADWSGRSPLSSLQHSDTDYDRVNADLRELFRAGLTFAAGRESIQFSRPGMAFFLKDSLMIEDPKRDESRTIVRQVENYAHSEPETLSPKRTGTTSPELTQQPASAEPAQVPPVAPEEISQALQGAKAIHDLLSRYMPESIPSRESSDPASPQHSVGDRQQQRNRDDPTR